MARSLFRSGLVIGVVAAALVASLGYLGFAQGEADPVPPDSGPPNPSLLGLREFLGPTIAAQERHTDRLMAIPDVVGTAVGLTADGQPAVKVYTKAAGVAGIPDSLEGVPVVVEVTGEFFALPESRKGSSPAGKGGSGIDPTSRFPRPVPIGVSTGNGGECSAGTIGARLKGGTDVYALSNNHVYALENSAPIGSSVLQPGLYDTQCTFDANNVIGQLAAFEPINFNCICFIFCSCDAALDNTIDAAVALSSAADLGNATPSNGYGTPMSATVSAFIDQPVQKYGRTTSLTKGKVTGINATVIVGYSSGYARFVDQIIVGSRKAFIKAGDSGSLLVTDPSANPVGLLYAGNSNGTRAIANRIDLVLNRFSLAVDGK
jgi:hypothetical protein